MMDSMNVFISDFFGLNNELNEIGVFDAIITSDSSFFINLQRLKNTSISEFKNSYNTINKYFDDIMLLLSNSNEKGDKFFCAALKKFNFYGGVKEINLGFSSTGVDTAFGKKLQMQVISDAYDIVKKGIKHPEIFQLVGLFEKGVAADRLSDMIARLIIDDIKEYTRNINRRLHINKDNYPNVMFNNEIAFNPYKNCDLLYLPIDILHEIPIASSWSDISNVISKNEAIRKEVNDEIGKEWKSYSSSQKKEYIKNNLIKVPDKCDNIINVYRNAIVGKVNIKNNYEYFADYSFKTMMETISFVENINPATISSFDASISVLNIFKDFVENNKGWDIINETNTKKREKFVQRLLHSCGKYYCDVNKIDMSFEPNEGSGSVDLKLSRGTDKTVIEIKLSTNNNYLHGLDRQLKKYAKSENTDNKVFVFIETEECKEKEDKIKETCELIKNNGEIPPEVYIIDAKPQKSASKK